MLCPVQIATAVELVRAHAEPDAQVTPSPAEGMVRFRTSHPEDKLAELLTQLVQAGIQVSQFRELQTDLEDTFLSITREDAPAAGSAEVSAAGV